MLGLEKAFHHLERGELRAVIRRHGDFLVLEHLRFVVLGIAPDDDGKHRHGRAKGYDLAAAESLAIRFDGALHDAPFAHSVLIDTALVVNRIERAVEHGIKLYAMRRGDLSHSGRGYELDI